MNNRRSAVGLSRRQRATGLADRQLVLPQLEVLYLPVSTPIPSHPPRGLSDPQPRPEQRLREGREQPSAGVVSGESPDAQCGQHLISDVLFSQIDGR